MALLVIRGLLIIQIRDFCFSRCQAYFWICLQINSNAAWARVLGFNFNGVSRATQFKENGYAVRCLKDD